MLRGDPEDCWGGDVSVLAWSLLRERRAQVHWRDYEQDYFRFDERTHWQVLDNMADPDKHPVLHLLYNGIDHYDLLLPDSGTDPVDPEKPAARPTAHAAQGRQTGESGGSHSSALVSGEVPDAMMAKQGVLAELSLYNVAEQSSHPHRRLEDLLSKLAAQRLRDSPTLPPHASSASVDAGEAAEALICFSCACIHTRVAETEDAGNIKWHRPLQRAAGATSATFLGRPLSEIANILGLDSFLEKYDRLEGDLKLTTFEDFAHWRVRLPSNDGGEDGHLLLCCPEDHRCAAHPQHVAEGCLCEECEVPLCSECYQQLKAGKLPPLSLCNDMWTGYAPERLYAENVTVMEMICASPCVTTLICMSMEARYRSDSSSLDEKVHPLDEKVHMARHRLGARGNALTFPLPWEDLLRKLQAHHGLLDSEAIGEASTQLPRSGPALGEVVRVLLKTNKTGKTSD
ncbi:pfh1, partial [Symbiodinium microadriaticum]